MHHLKDENIRDKIKATNLQRYGFENPGSNKDVDNRRRSTNLQRYGFENPMENPDIAKKSAQNRIHISRCIFPENMKRKTIDKWLKKKYTNPALHDTSSQIHLLSSKCKMMMIYKRAASIFVNKYHPWGWDRRGQLCLGWVYNNKLIQLITIGKSQDSNYLYQLYQICTHPRYVIQDGVEELFDYAIKYFEISNVISYVGSDEINILQKLGFTYTSKILPVPIWKYQDLILPDDQIFSTDIMKLSNCIEDKNKYMTSSGWIYDEIQFMEFSHSHKLS